MPLNENAKKWVEALRSGKYKQGIGQLCLDNNYCCLGVACVIAKENGLNVKIKKFEIKIEGFEYSNTKFDEVGAYLPKTVQTWLGLKNDRGKFGVSKKESLAELNDEGLSFEKIADIIEKQADKLFI